MAIVEHDARMAARAGLAQARWRAAAWYGAKIRGACRRSIFDRVGGHPVGIERPGRQVKFRSERALSVALVPGIERGNRRDRD